MSILCLFMSKGVDIWLFQTEKFSKISAFPADFIKKRSLFCQKQKQKTFLIFLPVKMKNQNCGLKNLPDLPTKNTPNFLK